MSGPACISSVTTDILIRLDADPKLLLNFLPLIILVYVALLEIFNLRGIIKVWIVISNALEQLFFLSWARISIVTALLEDWAYMIVFARLPII